MASSAQNQHIPSSPGKLSTHWTRKILVKQGSGSSRSLIRLRPSYGFYIIEGFLHVLSSRKLVLTTTHYAIFAHMRLKQLPTSSSTAPLPRYSGTTSPLEALLQTHITIIPSQALLGLTLGPTSGRELSTIISHRKPFSHSASGTYGQTGTTIYSTIEETRSLSPMS